MLLAKRYRQAIIKLKRATARRLSLAFLLSAFEYRVTLPLIMDGSVAPEHQSRVEKFQREHRTRLLTLLFTDIVGSGRIKQALGDREGVALIQRHHALVREMLSRFHDAQEIVA